MSMGCLIRLFAAVVVVSLQYCAGDDAPATTAAPIVCAQFSNQCSDCVGFTHAQCLWCPTATDTPKCMDYPVGDILPTKVCKLSDARWLNCWVNFEVLLIVVCVLGGILLLSFCCCIYCCCCRRGRRYRLRRDRQDEERDRRAREEREAKSAERKAERQAKYDDIRRKYGLSGTTEQPYSRFENE